MTSDQVTAHAREMSRSTPNPRSTVQLQATQSMLIPFPVVFVVLAFFCDLAFWRSGSPFWATAALWLLGEAVVFGLLAAVTGLTDFLGESRIRDLTDAWHHFIGNAAAIVLTSPQFLSARCEWRRSRASGSDGSCRWSSSGSPFCGLEGLRDGLQASCRRRRHAESWFFGISAIPPHVCR